MGWGLIRRAGLRLPGLILGLGALWAGDPGFAQHSPHLPANPVSVLSFNIRYANPADGANAWDQRRGAVIAYLHETDPDIMGLQEVLASQLDDLTSSLPGYLVAGVGRVDGARSGEFCPLLIRAARFDTLFTDTFWLSDTPDRPGSTSYGNTLPRIATRAMLHDRSTDTRFMVLNTHLDHESAAARLASVRQIQDSLARHETLPVIVLGDFNTAWNSAPMRLFTPSPADTFHRRLSPVWQGRDDVAIHRGSYHRWNGDWAGSPVDFILTCDRWTVREAEIMRSRYLDRWLSDHAPVHATIAIFAH